MCNKPTDGIVAVLTIIGILVAILSTVKVNHVTYDTDANTGQISSNTKPEGESDSTSENVGTDDVPAESTDGTASPSIILPVQSRDDCNIKGNISRKTGEKIYHMPGQKYYNSTTINTAYGERWFCSETEAQSAGWRKSKV